MMSRREYARAAAYEAGIRVGVSMNMGLRRTDLSQEERAQRRSKVRKTVERHMRRAYRAALVVYDEYVHGILPAGLAMEAERA